MISTRLTALVLLAGMLVITLFQIALVAGAPWGQYAMGGAYPGVYPWPMRMAALAQVFIYLGVAVMVVARMRWALTPLHKLSRTLLWPIAVLFAVATILNLISPSSPERLLWTPFAAVMFVASLRLALARR